MGFSYTATRSIEAPPHTVWQVLTDKAALLAGDFGITDLDGNLQAGGRLTLRAAIAPKQAFKLRVIAFEPDRLMIWQGGMPMGLFTGMRTFTLSAVDQGTHFTVEETFTGLLSGLIGKTMPDLQPSFEQFADALKSIAEEGAV